MFRKKVLRGQIESQMMSGLEHAQDVYKNLQTPV